MGNITVINATVGLSNNSATSTALNSTGNVYFGEFGTLIENLHLTLTNYSTAAYFSFPQYAGNTGILLGYIVTCTMNFTNVNISGNVSYTLAGTCGIIAGSVDNIYATLTNFVVSSP